MLLAVLLTAGAEYTAVLHMRRLAAAGRLSAFGIDGRTSQTAKLTGSGLGRTG